MQTILDDPWAVPVTGDGWIKPKPKTRKVGKFSGVTHVTLVLDKSGSMEPVKQEVVTGVNTWLATMRKEAGSFPTTIVLFDTSVTTPVLAIPVRDIRDLTLARYRPSGFTALNDALAKAITATEGRLSPGDRALVCVVTDGQENASRMYPVYGGGTQRIRQMIEEKEAQGNWTFTYLSASPNAFADAEERGIKLGNTLVFTADAAGTTTAWNATARATHAYSSGATGQTTSFYGPVDDDEDTAKAP
jgi:hypothetical protein